MQNQQNVCECCDCSSHGGKTENNEKIKLVVGAILFAVGYAVHEFTKAPEFAAVLCFGLSYVLSGFGVVKNAVSGILGGKWFDENLLITIASLGAFAIREYSEGCAVMLLYLLGEMLQRKAVQKSREKIFGLLESEPGTIRLVLGEDEKIVFPDSVKPGDTVKVMPEERIHLDGIVISGTSQVDTKDLTGRIIPETKSPGDSVNGGCVNIDGTLVIRVTVPYSETAAAKIIKSAEADGGEKSGAEQFIGKFSKIYTPLICVIALLTAVITPLFFGGQWSEWLHRGLSALVVGCPCAIVISVPLCFFSGIGSCSKFGMLVKSSGCLELLGNCNTAAFDKTGTVTTGKFEYVKCECVNCHCTDKHEHRELLKIIAACERQSSHRIAKSVSLAFGVFADEAVVSDEKEYHEMGVSAVVDGTKYYVGSADMMRFVGVDFNETRLSGSVIYCCSESEFLGDIVFADNIREDSRSAIAEMKKLGINTAVMLVSDKNALSDTSCAEIDENIFASSPEEKADKVTQLKGSGSKVLYVGNGIGDVPVMSSADLGIAIGAGGAESAINAADIVITDDSLSALPKGIRTAKKVLLLAKENIVFSVGIKLVILALDIFLASKLPMWVAVFGDVGVCLLAVANSLRAMIVKKN